MKKSSVSARSASNGRFVSKPLGKGKAAAFSRVEGMTLDARSASTILQLERNGIKGHDLRSAIMDVFASKRG